MTTYVAIPADTMDAIADYHEEVRQERLNQKATANGDARVFEAKKAEEKRSAEEEKKKNKLDSRNRKKQERTRKLRRNLLQMLAWMVLDIATVVAVKAQLVHPYIGSSVVSICLLSEGWLLGSAQVLKKKYS